MDYVGLKTSSLVALVGSAGLAVGLALQGSLANFAGGTAVRMQKVDMEKYPEFPDVPIEVYDWGINVNFRAQFYFAHAVAKQMREQKSGIIINIGSISGMEGDAYHMEYPAAKSGVMYGLTKGLAQFGAKHNIRCVCISPGPVLTRLVWQE